MQWKHRLEKRPADRTEPDTTEDQELTDQEDTDSEEDDPMDGGQSYDMEDDEEFVLDDTEEQPER